MDVRPNEIAENQPTKDRRTTLLLLDNDKQTLAQLRDTAQNLIDNAALPFVIRCFTDPGAMEAAAQAANGYCICIIDILMDDDTPGGIALARRLRAKNLDLDIVFATSSRDYAIEGYEVYAAGYLLKPVAEADFARVLRHLLDVRRVPDETLELVSGRMKIAIPLSTILYVDVYGKNCFVHTHERVITTTMRLKEICSLLPKDRFLQCHRSCVVNLAHVRAALNDHLEMDNGDRVPIRMRESLAIRARCAEFLWSGMNREGV